MSLKVKVENGRIFDLNFEFSRRKTFERALPQGWFLLILETPTIDCVRKNGDIVMSLIGDPKSISCLREEKDDKTIGSEASKCLSMTRQVESLTHLSSENSNTMETADCSGAGATADVAKFGELDYYIEGNTCSEVEMKDLMLPWADPSWNLFITNALSLRCIWARIIGSEYSVSLRCLTIAIAE